MVLWQNIFVIIALCGFPSLINAKVQIEKIDFEQFDSEFVKVQTTLRKEGDENVVDIEADVLQDLGNKLFIQVLIEKAIDGKMKTLYKSDLVDKCHFIENKDKYPQLRMLLDDLKKYGNFMQSCPVNKGKYSMKGFKFEPKEDFIHLLSPGEYAIHFTMFRGLAAENKQLYSVKWVAKIE